MKQHSKKQTNEWKNQMKQTNAWNNSQDNSKVMKQPDETIKRIKEMKVTYVVVSPPWDIYMVLGVPVAQMVEYVFCKLIRVGSNPITSMVWYPTQHKVSKWA